MVFIDKRIITALIILFFLTLGLLAYRSIYDNRIPKSAKLVFLLEEKLYKF